MNGLGICNCSKGSFLHDIAASQQRDVVSSLCDPVAEFGLVKNLVLAGGAAEISCCLANLTANQTDLRLDFVIGKLFLDLS